MNKVLQKSGVTLKEIAREANCSISVVSTVLNQAKGNIKVSNETRDHIQSIARGLGYRPNFASQSLKSRRSKTLGIYVQPKTWHGLSNEYEMNIFRGIEQAVRERNYDLLVLNICREDIAPEICSEKLTEARIDGVLVLHASHDAEWLRRLVKFSSNVVAINYNGSMPNLNAIQFDNEAAVELAVRHLVELGHRRIGFAGNGIRQMTEVPLDTLLREQAFVRMLKKYDLDTDEMLLFNQDKCEAWFDSKDHYCRLEGKYAIRHFARLPVPPTAIIAYNTLVSAAIMHEAKKLGIGIPKDMSLIGIDYMSFIELLEPRLTFIDHMLPQMGYAGANALVDLIEKKSVPPILQVFKPEFVAGETIRPLN